MKNNNFKRIIHRCFEELKVTKKIAEVTNWKKGIKTFIAKMDIQIMNHNGFYENDKKRKHLIEKHDIMIEYFEKTFSDFLKKYNNQSNNKNSTKDMSDVIWICWWQGYENAPEIVKKCIDSVKKHAGNHKVILLTENNYKEYVRIPKWVEEKKEKGIITRTNYSDLLRLSLLAEHGGMWLDSTFYCVSDEIQNYFTLPLWSIKRPDYYHASVASGYFAGYSLYCSFKNRYIFATIRDFFLNYWKNNDDMVDYLLIDYMIVLAQRFDSRIHQEFKKIPNNNKNCDELIKIINSQFDEKKWKEICDGTCLFKLSWKNKCVSSINGKKTFYGKITES